MTLVKPELLGAIREEAASISTKRDRLEEPLGLGSALLEFTEQTFDQALRTLLGVHVPDFTQAGKEEVLALAQRRAESDREVSADLLNLYVDVCNIWPDVISETYGGSPGDFLEFRTELLPELLSELARLAESREESNLYQELVAARDAYSDALAAAR